jgi:hypothetical protein
MGRQQGFTAWELDAARRREVVATDFGAERRFDGDRAPDSRDHERGGIRVPSWLATIGRVVGGSSREAAPTHPDCQPRVRAIRPGS